MIKLSSNDWKASSGSLKLQKFLNSKRYPDSNDSERTRSHCKTQDLTDFELNAAQHPTALVWLIVGGIIWAKHFVPTSSCRCRQGSFRNLHQIWSFKFPQTLAPVPFPCGIFSPRCDGGNTVLAVKILASVSTRANFPPPSLSADARTQLDESPSLLFQGLLRSSPEL